MWLVAGPCRIVPVTKTAEDFGVPLVRERHRHRFEVNPEHLPALEEGGLVVSGVYTERDLVDIAELADHPFMLGSQFHPEFTSRPLSPHPLFLAFMKVVRAGAELDQTDGPGAEATPPAGAGLVPVMAADAE
jgi:CTP synthase